MCNVMYKHIGHEGVYSIQCVVCSIQYAVLVYSVYMQSVCTVLVYGMQHIVCSIRYAVLVYNACIQCVCTVVVCGIQYIVCSVQYTVFAYSVLGVHKCVAS